MRRSLAGLFAVFLLLLSAGGAPASHLPPRHEGYRLAFTDARHGVMSATEVLVTCPRSVCPFSVYATSDDGRTWSRTLTAPLSVAYAAELGAAPGTSVVWASFPCDDDAACRSSLYRSGDGGLRWRLVSRATAFAPSFSSPLHGWAISRGGPVVVTRDGGRTWRRLPKDPCPPEVAWWRYLATVSPNRGWILCRDNPAEVSGSRALYETVDGGRSWRLRAARAETLPRLGRGFEDAFAIRSISFRPSGAGWIWRYAGPPLVTADGGRSWRPVPQWPFGSVAWGSGPSATTGVAIADNGREQLLVRTVDRGRSWRIFDRWPHGSGD